MIRGHPGTLTDMKNHRGSWVALCATEDHKNAESYPGATADPSGPLRGPSG